MKKSQYIIGIVCVAALMSSCNIYKQYQRPDVDTQGLYRDPVSATDTLVSDTTNMGMIPWEEMFTDPWLQSLIQQGLEKNSDLRTAMLQVDQAEAQLKAARLAYTPSVALAPTGGVSSFDKGKGQWTWTAPVSASWEIDLFGRLLNSKRGAKAALMQSQEYKQAVQTQLISTIANYYYTLLMLDKQLSITEETAVSWKKSVETMRSLKENTTTTNEAAVVQSEANSYMIEATIPDLQQQIRETENALCMLLHQAPQQIARGTLEEQDFPEIMRAGVPVQLLSNRPDVKSAEMALAAAYYNTNVARSAFYPSLSLSGTYGWTNSAGSMVVNPGKMIASAVGSLTQPLFARGQLTAQLKIAKAQQEEASLAFQQTLLNAGIEVNDALTAWQTSTAKRELLDKQVASLQNAVKSTSLLMEHGTTTYLEVLTAKQNLLSAQLTQTANRFTEIQSLINLYSALGGGQE